MPLKRRSSVIRSTPKQFRCTGYGDCNMVFTRSEHLARHERKHTGEKPYKCVVESCGRMFSRFDNMMQHTQTHGKERRNSDDYDRKGRAVVTDDPMTDSPHQLIKEPFPWAQRADMFSVPPLDYTPMVHNRTLPPPQGISLSTPIGQSYPYSLPPSPVRTHDDYHNRSSWPLKNKHARRSSVSTISTDSGRSYSPSVHYDFNMRRISIDALKTPIEQLGKIQLDEKRPMDEDAVDISQDEYEVLEAFSQLCTSSVNTSDLSSHVYAAGKRAPISKESFSRPVSHHYLV